MSKVFSSDRCLWKALSEQLSLNMLTTWKGANWKPEMMEWNKNLIGQNSTSKDWDEKLVDAWYNAFNS